MRARDRFPPVVYILVFGILFALSTVARTTEAYSGDLPVDYGNYVQGIRLLYQGRNPYTLEFFAPPWIAFLLSPYYLLKHPLFWQTTCALCVIILLIFSYRWLPEQGSDTRPLILGMTLLFVLPTTIFAIALGQLSSLVGLAISLAWAFVAGRKATPWAISFVLILTTLKIHVVFVPFLLLMAELFRQQAWRTILILALTVTLLALASSWFLYENWITALMNAVFLGRKFLGGEGLAASFYFSYANAGIPAVVFIPHLIYVVARWLKEGLHPYLFLLAITLNFLVIPYSRQYDYVILLPACFYLYSQLWNSRWRYGLWVIFWLFFGVLSLFTKLSFLIPAIILMLLLWLPGDAVKGCDSNFREKSGSHRLRSAFYP
jgi:hypothetical protein